MVTHPLPADETPGAPDHGAPDPTGDPAPADPGEQPIDPEPEPEPEPDPEPITVTDPDVPPSGSVPPGDEPAPVPDPEPIGDEPVGDDGVLPPPVNTDPDGGDTPPGTGGPGDGPSGDPDDPGSGGTTPPGDSDPDGGDTDDGGIGGGDEGDGDEGDGGEGPTDPPAEDDPGTDPSLPPASGTPPTGTPPTGTDPVGTNPPADPVDEGSPVNATQPAKDRPLGLQLIDYGPLVADTPAEDVPGARETSVTRLKKTLSDGKFAYSFTFEFVADKQYAADRRYLVQALRNTLVLVAPDGSVSRPKGVTKEDGYVTYKVDQRYLPGLNTKPGANPTAQDIRLAGPLGADGGEIIGPNPKDLEPAVFGIQIVDAVAGLSDTKYQPIKGEGDRLSNLPVTKTQYEKVRDAIVAQRTETRTVYIFYNPAAYKGEGDPGKFVLDALGKSDPATRKVVEDALKAMKLTLGNKGFESYSFSSFADLSPALTVPIK